MGFKNKLLNSQIRRSIFDDIINHLIVCSQNMVADCTNVNFLRNHEDKITNRLCEMYLNKQNIGLRFIPQVPEHFDEDTDTYVGRTDIKVFGKDTLRDHRAYYTIESKRIDGSPKLNTEYVQNGVTRFICLHPDETAKYSSHYRRNIMFGYVVNAIVI